MDVGKKLDLSNLGLSGFVKNPSQTTDASLEKLQLMLQLMLQNPTKNDNTRNLALCVSMYFTSKNGGNLCCEWDYRKDGKPHERSHGGKCGNQKWAKDAAVEYGLCVSCFLLMRESLHKQLKKDLQLPMIYLILALKEKCKESEILTTHPWVLSKSF
jgi:hypothetical protein